MRKFGLITVAAGFCALAAAAALLAIGAFHPWELVPGIGLIAAGAGILLAGRGSAVAPAAREIGGELRPMGSDTARLLDNFEQRFAELKGRKPSATVLIDLYALGTQLEQRNRAVQATAVYRYLARIDATYRDVTARLKRLMDAEASRANEASRAAAARAAAARGSAATAGAPPRPAAGQQAPPRAEPAAAPLEPARSDGPAARDEGTPVRQLGRYRLEREIGRGAMGVVYLGRDTAINREVAIKAIPLAAEFGEAELEEARSRFFREAETAGRLNHPHIVTIYDVGEEQGLAYIAMEYLAGRHLSDHAAANRLLEPRKVIELMARTADALGFAHKREVVHRDIKPANLMYDPASDVLKITDFGIARLSGAGSTRTGIVLGTPSFMSPEQLEGRTVTGHSDLFSLGVSLYQLLTGHLPFTADSMTGLMQQIAEAPHPPLRAYRPDLPGCVETVIDRALAKRPEDRFDTGAQMAAALEDCRARIPSGLP